MNRLFLSVALLSFYLSGCLALENGYKTCELIGVTHFRKFEANNTIPFENFLHSGKTLLLGNKWVKVYHLINFNEPTMTVENRRLFILFYDGKNTIPLSLGTDMVLNCLDNDCSYDCTMSVNITGIGVKKSVLVNFKYDAVNGHVIYFNHFNAEMTFYIRKAKGYFNFGIRVPDKLTQESEGLCTTGLPIQSDMSSKCIDEELGRKVCNAVFNGLKVEEYRYDPCIKDIYLWENVNYAADHRLAYLDMDLIRNFQTINNKYDNITIPSVSSYQSMIFPINCNGFAKAEMPFKSVLVLLLTLIIINKFLI